MTCTLQGTIVRLENELSIVGLQQAENSLHPSSGGSPVSETSSSFLKNPLV